MPSNSRHGRLIDGLRLLAQPERELAKRSHVDPTDIVTVTLSTAG